MSDPVLPPSPDYLTPALRWLARAARRSLTALSGQVGVNLALGVASAVGLAGGIPAVAPYIHLASWNIPWTVHTRPSRVILVYESSAIQGAMSPGQIDALFSAATRDYLDGTIAPDEAGRAAWRCWDKDVDVSGESKAWQDAWAKIKPALNELPRVVIYDARGNPIAYPVPDSPEGLVQLLDSYKD